MVLGDLLVEAMTKYNGVYQNLPIYSQGLVDTGSLMKRRMVYDAMGVQGMLTVRSDGLSSLSLSADPTRTAGLTNPADGLNVVAPVTGVMAGTNPGIRPTSNPEVYGSGSAAKVISYFNLGTENAYQTGNILAPVWDR
jgi:hypothetical protein